MVELPENFPEYSIMYKTLSKQIKTLEESKESAVGKEREEIQNKILKYQEEITRINKKFPENFFEELN